MVRSHAMPLSSFHPFIAEWFLTQVGRPTDVQQQAWPAIQSGADALIAAPTGSGKTLAAFLSCIDSLFKQALARELDDHTQVLYVSPLKALSNDIQKNLQKPLAEIGQSALQAGLLMPELRVLVRTGDTPMADRQQMLKRPPHILVKLVKVVGKGNFLQANIHRRPYHLGHWDAAVPAMTGVVMVINR